MLIKHKNYTFKKWLKSPIETVDGVIYDVDDDSSPITHLDFVNSVYSDLMQIIKKNDYTITYKKSFRIKLAKILYSLSDNSSYGPTL